MNTTKTRVATALVMVVLLVPLLFVPPLVLHIVIGLFSLIAAYELFSVQRQASALPFALILYPLVATASSYTVLYLAMNGTLGVPALILWLFSSVLAVGVLLVFVRAFTAREAGFMFFSVLYVGGTFAALAGIFSYSVLAVVYVLLVAMTTDIFAYFIGLRFGKRRLAPSISPKKSVEGALGGTFVAVFVSTLYAWFTDIFPVAGTVVSSAVIVGVGVFVSVFAQIGDLIASRIKREYGVKDFSKLLPGHGGLLDRFDSSIFAALAMAIVLLGMGVIG